MPSPKDIARRIEDLTVIDEYERGIGREGLPYVIEKFAANAFLPDEKWAEFHARALKCSDYLLTGYELDSVLAGTFGRPSDVMMCREMPPALKQLGFPNLPIFYSQQHVHDALKPKGQKHHHGLILNDLKLVPELLESPVMVFDAPFKRDKYQNKVSNGIGAVVMLERRDSDNIPLMCFFSIYNRPYQGVEQPCCMLKSVYGRTGWAQYARNAFEDRTVLFCDPIKFQSIKKDLLRCHGTLCPQSLESLSHSISQTKQLVNSDLQDHPPKRRLRDLSNDVQAQQHDTQISAHHHSGKTHEERSR